MHELYICDCGFKTASPGQAERHKEVFEDKPHKKLSEDRCPICGQRGELGIPNKPDELVCPTCYVVLSIIWKQIDEYSKF